MSKTIRIFLLIEAVSFGLASLIHAGVLMAGYEHSKVRIAESVITLVLLAALVLTWLRPAWVRWAGLAGQGFALLDTLVGVTLVGVLTIAVGIGPLTVPDVVYHIAIIAVLIWGLVVARRTRAMQASKS